MGTSYDPEFYPEPQPAHVRDGVNTSALPEKRQGPLRSADSPQGVRMVGKAGEQHEVRHTDYVPAAVHQVLANRFQQERTAKRAAEEELEQARRLIGQGPFVIVKLGSLNAVTDQGQAEVRVGFGGGVTRHMLESVLSIGLQAVRESLPPGARAEQEDTVRLSQPMQVGGVMHYWREGGGFICGADAGFRTTSPLDVTCRRCLEGIPQVGALFGVDAHGGVRPIDGCDWPAVDCVGHPQPAQKPQEGTGTPDPRDVPPGY